jgi:hypothetical protein
MKLWHIAALVVGVGFIMVLVRNMQAAKATPVGTGATGNDVIVGLSKFGSGLIDLGGKIFAPAAAGASQSDPYRDIRNESPDDYVKRLDAGFGTE